jgi:hypothetical protein
MMKTEIRSLIDRSEKADLEVKELFGSLSPAQLNFRPGERSWSIAECMDHIRKTNLSYFEEFERVMEPGYRNNWWKKVNPFTITIGRSMIKTLGPDKMKTFVSPKLFQPDKEVPRQIIEQFLEAQVRLRGYLASLQESTNIIIYSPVSSVITLRLHDAFHILIGHEERHIMQAKNILENESFPDN